MIEFPEDLRDQFTPQRLIGEGGMGAVILADERALGRPVAIKFLHAFEDEELRQRFLREAKVMARIEHPNVVRLYSAGISTRGPWIAMEYIEGQPLHEVERHVNVMKVFIGIARGIEAIHQVGLVHRDIKPPNVILTPDDRPVLLDLGLARAVEGTRLTSTGAVVGTMGFMPPEHLRGQPIGPPGDWFAWGVSLYSLLEGKYPWGTVEMVSFAKGGSLRPLEFSRIPATSPMAVLLRRVLVEDPAARPSSVAEIDAIYLEAERAKPEAPRSQANVRPTEALDASFLDLVLGKDVPLTIEGDASAELDVLSASLPEGLALAKPSWWRTRFLHFYLPILVAWIVAGGLAWVLFPGLFGKGGTGTPAMDVRERIEARVRADSMAAAAADQEARGELLRLWEAALPGLGGFGDRALRDRSRGDHHRAERRIPAGPIEPWGEFLPVWSAWVVRALEEGGALHDPARMDPELLEASLIGPFRVARRARQVFLFLVPGADDILLEISPEEVVERIPRRGFGMYRDSMPDPARIADLQRLLREYRDAAARIEAALTERKARPPLVVWLELELTRVFAQAWDLGLWEGILLEKLEDEAEQEILLDLEARAGELATFLRSQAPVALRGPLLRELMDGSHEWILRNDLEWLRPLQDALLDGVLEAPPDVLQGALVWAFRVYRYRRERDPRLLEWIDRGLARAEASLSVAEGREVCARGVIRGDREHRRRKRSQGRSQETTYPWDGFCGGG